MSMMKDILGKIAPVLGSAIGGPFGGMAAKFLADKLGVPETSLEETIASADPGVMLEIKKLDAEFKTTMAELGLKEEQLHADDRGNARTMAINTTLVPQMVISVIFVITFGVILYTVFTAPPDTFTGSQKDIIMYMLGILSAGMVQVMNFWFGSSSGSKEKTSKLKV